VFLDNHVAEVDPDPELDALLRRGARVAIGHPALYLDCAPDGVHHAPKLGQETVAGVLYDPAPVLGDLGVDQLTEMSFEPLVRPLLIRPHQARVPGHIGGKDRGEAAGRGHVSRGGRLV
jgi:hypothetical protein